MNSIEKVIREYIPNVIHMSIATSTDNTPWISEVHFSYDEHLNLYFLSRPNRRHSIEALLSSRIAGNIIKQHQKGEKVRGVYFEGHIKMLEGVTDGHPSFETYGSRFGTGEEILKEQLEENGHRFFQISVQKFYLFDEVEETSKGKYELEWGK